MSDQTAEERRIATDIQRRLRELEARVAELTRVTTDLALRLDEADGRE